MKIFLLFIIVPLLFISSCATTKDRNSKVIETEPTFDFEEFKENLIYPEKPLLAGIEGEVVVRVLVHKKGKVTKTKIISSDSILLNEAAISAVLNTKFTPATQNGENVNAWLTIPITFRLK